jgi:hypothetical protein
MEDGPHSLIFLFVGHQIYYQASSRREEDVLEWALEKSAPSPSAMRTRWHGIHFITHQHAQ